MGLRKRPPLTLKPHEATLLSPAPPMTWFQSSLELSPGHGPVGQSFSKLGTQDGMVLARVHLAPHHGNNSPMAYLWAHRANIPVGYGSGLAGSRSSNHVIRAQAYSPSAALHNAVPHLGLMSRGASPRSSFQKPKADIFSIWQAQEEALPFSQFQAKSRDWLSLTRPGSCARP